jgi:hypothetical protein
VGELVKWDIDTTGAVNRHVPTEVGFARVLRFGGPFGSLLAGPLGPSGLTLWQVAEWQVAGRIAASIVAFEGPNPRFLAILECRVRERRVLGVPERALSEPDGVNWLFQGILPELRPPSFPSFAIVGSPAIGWQSRAGGALLVRCYLINGDRQVNAANLRGARVPISGGAVADAGSKRHGSSLSACQAGAIGQ